MIADERRAAPAARMLGPARRAIVVLALAALPALAQGGLLERLTGGAESTILPAEQAFPLQVEQTAPGRLTLRWDVRRGYYLYRDKLDVMLAGGTENAVTSVRTPPGERIEDPYFGPTEVYHGPVSATVTLRQPATPETTIIVRYQGCAEGRLCYPLQRIEYRLGQGVVASGIDGGPASAPEIGNPTASGQITPRGMP